MRSYEKEIIARNKTGTVIKFIGDRGFGFIEPEEEINGGENIFFNITTVTELISEYPKPGSTVLFDLAPDKKHIGYFRAVNVRVIREY